MAEARIVHTQSTRIPEFTEWMLPLSSKPVVPLTLGEIVIVSPEAEALLTQSFRNPNHTRDMLLVLYSLKHGGSSAVAAYLPLQGAVPGSKSVWIKTPVSRAFTTVESDGEHKRGSVWLNEPALQAAMQEQEAAAIRRGPAQQGIPAP
jgi:hypothetical protein